MGTDYTYDETTKTYTYRNGNKTILHISEAEFGNVCRKFEQFGLTYSPADWDWRCYPDIGFANLHDDIWMHNGWNHNVTWGHSRYHTSDDGRHTSEEIIRTELKTPDGKTETHDYVIDTEKQLTELLERFFGVKLKARDGL